MSINISSIGDIIMSPHDKYKDEDGVDVYDLINLEVEGGDDVVEVLYPVLYSKTSPEVYYSRYESSDGSGSEYFGYMVAISNGVKVVSAHFQNNMTGAVYVYGYQDFDEIKITSSTNFSAGRFGHSVAIQGDTLVVGAYIENVLYIYTLKDSSNNYQEIRVSPSNPISKGQFGYSVALHGDRLVTTSYVDDNRQPSILNFLDLGSDGFPETVLEPSDNVSGNKFGNNIGIYETTIIASAGGISSFYLFDLTSPTSEEVIKVEGNGDFGSNVAISGNYVATSSDYKVYVYDISVVSNPVLYKEIAVPFSTSSDLDMSGDYLAVSNHLYNAGKGICIRFNFKEDVPEDSSVVMDSDVYSDIEYLGFSCAVDEESTCLTGSHKESSYKGASYSFNAGKFIPSITRPSGSTTPYRIVADLTDS